jgi:hypothetical protein
VTSALGRISVVILALDVRKGEDRYCNYPTR